MTSIFKANQGAVNALLRCVLLFFIFSFLVLIFLFAGTNEDKKTLLERNYKIEMAWFTPYASLPGWRPAGILKLLVYEALSY